MTEDLSGLFAAQQANVIEWDGGLVYGLYEFPLVPEKFTVEFISAKPSPVQGLNLKIRGGVLLINDVEADDVVLWRDTAPDAVERPREDATGGEGFAESMERLAWVVGCDSSMAGERRDSSGRGSRVGQRESALQ